MIKEIQEKRIYKITVSAIFVALATALSLIKIINMPLGGSVTLLSMLPIVMISCMLGVKWGLIGAFAYSLLQLFLGITVDGLFGWGLTPAMLIGTILFDYILAFSCLGIAGIFRKKGTLGITSGVILSLFIRFISHFISGYVIFKNLEQFEVFGNIFTNRPILYSICYNGFYMLPEIVMTALAAAIIFSAPQIKKLIDN